MNGGPFEPTPPPRRPRPREEPPADYARRETEWAAGGGERDTTPAVGTPGEPASWRRAEPGADVGLTHSGFQDAQWSFLYGSDTAYADVRPADGEVAAANRRARGGTETPPVAGPVIKPPVWTWEIPVYFWFGGIASGSAFVAFACDLAGDHRSARIARLVSMGAVSACPPLLIADLGRPARFLNMLRIFKPRSPMNLGAWALSAFSVTGSVAVAADLLGAPRAARVAGGATAVIGGYLGSYTGVLLASTSVPLWSRSRLLLGPIFVTTATATGAAASRLALAAAGLPTDHPTRRALAVLETSAIVTELGLSRINERRLGPLGEQLDEGRGGRLFRAATWAVNGGLTLRALSRQAGSPAHHLGSVLFLAAGLCFRWAWIEAGRQSARDDEDVARTHRVNVEEEDWIRRLLARRMPSSHRPARQGGLLRRAAGLYADGVRRTSLTVERLLGTPRGSHGSGR
ncbi:MAG TPA: NrfD/PsrC family molybdoenzyme membrane anchor subunit [Capillimicrobium sp.]|nr:NrfD/PsrC family molybdoenzyme membrane anchor subunit [Capillimicrobium sp.]